MIKKELSMYFNEKIAREFAVHEQNEKNFRVAAIVDRIIIYNIKGLQKSLYAADLGAGAHPDRYQSFFKALLINKGHIDWVDTSPIMLKLAKEYISKSEHKERLEIISFIKEDILNYLDNLPDAKLDVAIMKYTFDHLADIEKLFRLLSKKLKKKGVLVSTMTTLSPELKSISTNARFFYKGKEFPVNETRTLKDGEDFTIKFFKISGKPELGYIEGGETTKYYHSPEKIKELANKYGFKIFLGDWKDYLPKKEQDNETMNQDVLILVKRQSNNL